MKREKRDGRVKKEFATAMREGVALEKREREKKERDSRRKIQLAPDYSIIESLRRMHRRRDVSFRNIDSGTKRVEKERKKKNFQAAGRNRRMKLNRISPRTSFVDSLPLFFFLSPSSFSKLISRFVKTIVG